MTSGTDVTDPEQTRRLGVGEAEDFPEAVVVEGISEFLNGKPRARGGFTSTPRSSPPSPARRWWPCRGRWIPPGPGSQR